MFAEPEKFITIYSKLVKTSNEGQITGNDDNKTTADLIDETIDKLPKIDQLLTFLNKTNLNITIPEIKEIKSSLNQSPTLANKLTYEGGNNLTQKIHKINKNKTVRKNK
jgi:ferritin